MKRYWLVPCLLVGVACSAADAALMDGDIVKYDGIWRYGGDVQTGSQMPRGTNGGPFRFRNENDSNSPFATFCVELTDTISNGHRYKAVQLNNFFTDEQRFASWLYSEWHERVSDASSENNADRGGIFAGMSDLNVNKFVQTGLWYAFDQSNLSTSLIDQYTKKNLNDRGDGNPISSTDPGGLRKDWYTVWDGLNKPGTSNLVFELQRVNSANEVIDDGQNQIVFVKPPEAEIPGPISLAAWGGLGLFGFAGSYRRRHRRRVSA